MAGSLLGSDWNETRDKNVPHRMDLKRGSHNDEEVSLRTILNHTLIEGVRQVFSKEYN